MSKLLNITKVVAINLAIFLVLLLVVNWICGFFLTTAQATRYELPNFEKDREYAKQVFKDYNSVQHEYFPFVGWKTKPYSGKTTHIDKTGERIHTPPARTGEATSKVHFFGGS